MEDLEDFFVDIYSKRAVRQNKVPIDVYHYDEIPEYVRNQIKMKLIDDYYEQAFLHDVSYQLCKVLSRQYGDYLLLNEVGKN